MINVSVIFLFNLQKQVLLQLRDNDLNIKHPNTWGPLGGHCIENETTIECAKREFFEESGYQCGIVNFYENYILPYENNIFHQVSVYWSIFDYKQQINCFEGQKIEFITISQLNKINISNKNKTIIKLISKLII